MHQMTTPTRAGADRRRLTMEGSANIVRPLQIMVPARSATFASDPLVSRFLCNSQHLEVHRPRGAESSSGRAGVGTSAGLAAPARDLLGRLESEKAPPIAQ